MRRKWWVSKMKQSLKGVRRKCKICKPHQRKSASTLATKHVGNTETNMLEKKLNRSAITCCRQVGKNVWQNVGSTSVDEVMLLTDTHKPTPTATERSSVDGLTKLPLITSLLPNIVTNIPLNFAVNIYPDVGCGVFNNASTCL